MEYQCQQPQTQNQEFGSDSSRNNNDRTNTVPEAMANNFEMASSCDNNNSNINNEPDLSFCILWSPLHPITALLPFIGHLGISDSMGRAHDFRGPYTVQTDGSKPLPVMAFGPPTRYLKIDIGDLTGGASKWDEAIFEADGIYDQRMHNICCDNCHSHVARALNILEHEGRHDWNMVKLCFWVFFKGSFVDYKGAILLQFGPFLVLLVIYLLATGALF
jgi:hypothetical protein